MKQLLFSSLITNPDIVEVVNDRIYGQGTLGIETVPANPKKPFIIYHIGDGFTFAGMNDVTRPERTALQFYAYQKRGSYETINGLLVAIRETLLALPGTSSPSGLYRCTGLDWGGFSRESEDEAYDANMRWASAEIVGTQW